MTRADTNVARRTSATPTTPLMLRGKSSKKKGLQPVAQSAGGYPTGLFGYRAKPKEAIRNVRVWQRVAELVVKLKRKKKAFIGNDRGNDLPLDGSDFVNPMTGPPITR